VTYESLDHLVVAYCTDLSKGGMFLATDEILEPGSVVRVNLELPESSGEVPILCRVIHTRPGPEPDPEGRPPGMGLRFLDVNDDALTIIECYISERLSAQADAVRPVAATRRLNLLVVDDDPAVLKLAAAPFRARGDYVRTATDGMEALAYCLVDPPDLVVTDVNMPRMDGWQLLRMMRARPLLDDVPVVFLTTLSSDEDRLRGYELGVDDYVPKPFRTRELRARVDRLAERRRVFRRPPPNTLRGDLELVPLASVLTFLELERKTGVLVVDGAVPAQIKVRLGAPIGVEADEPVADPVALLFKMLDGGHGSFEFFPGTVEGEDAIGRSVTALVLEHARLRDEEQR
jgi:uncharacterized protein (TIGR02266 family)